MLLEILPAAGAQPHVKTEVALSWIQDTEKLWVIIFVDIFNLSYRADFYTVFFR